MSATGVEPPGLAHEVTDYLTTSWLWPDPFPLFKRMREQEPVHYNKELDMWVVTNLGLARTHLRDDRLVRDLAANRELAAISEHPKGAATERYLHATLLNLDGPEHRRIRQLVSHAFSARALDLWRPLIIETVDEIIDSVDGLTDIEFMSQVAYPLPEKVICRMMGLPHSAHADFERWTYVITSINYAGDPGSEDSAVKRAIAAGEEYGEYLRELIVERRRNLGDDLISVLIRAQENSDHLADDEIIGTIMSLVTAGHGTTAMLAGNALVALLGDRQQWDRLCQEPAIVPSAVEEILRYDSPARSLPRVAREDLEIGGHLIRQGQRVLFPLPAVNRDEKLCPHADSFDVTRSPTKHIAFGFGPHVCLGAPLAREQAVHLFNGLVRRLPDIELAESIAKLEYIDVWQRGLRTLPLVRGRR